MPATNINLDSPFEPEKLLQLLESGTLHKMARQGYVAQAGSDGKMRFVHYTKARTRGHYNAQVGTQLKRETFQNDVDFKKDDLTPIVKRTPQQRVQSMVERLVEECRRTGTIPGHTDAQIREITGEYWKTGRTEVTTSMLAKVVQKYLDEAEKDAAMRDAKRTTRYHEYGQN